MNPSQMPTVTVYVYRDVNFLKPLLNDFCALLPCLIALTGNYFKNEGLAVID